MEPEKKSNGTVVGIIIVIVILVMGGIYTWQSKVKETLKEKAAQENTLQNDADALNILDQDLNGTDTNLNIDTNILQ